MSRIKYSKEELHELQIELEIRNNEFSLNKINEKKESYKASPQAMPLYNKLLFMIYEESRDNIDAIIQDVFKQKGNMSVFYSAIIKPYADKYYEMCEKYGKGANDFISNPADLLTYLTADAIISHGIGKEKPFIKVCSELAASVCMGTSFNLQEADISINKLLSSTGELIYCAIQSCDFLEEIQFKYDPSGSNKLSYGMKLTKETQKQFEDQLDNLHGDINYYEPMLVEPLDHKDLISGEGGYLTASSPLLKRYKRFKGQPHKLLQECNDRTKPWLFRVLNSMQKIPYRIDAEMLDLLGEVFFYISEDDSPDCDKFNIYNRAVNYRIEQAIKFRHYEQLYFPLFLDQRARMYPYANKGLSYNSDDLGKSLIEYAEGQVLNDDGVNALKFALGEYLGVPKVIGDARLQVVEEALPELIKQYEERDWSFIKGLDAPFGFISILKELVNYYKDPEGYVSYKILHLDSCSSGLQMMGLFCSCLETLEITNVINPVGDTIEDLYLKVAREVEKMVLIILAHPDEYSPEMVQAALLSEATPGLLSDRKVPKTAAMTRINYNSKRMSCNRNILEVLWSKYNDTLQSMAGDVEVLDFKQLFNSKGSLKSKDFPVVSAFCDLIMSAIERTSPTALNAQKWLQGLITFATKKDDCFAYVNNLNGFPTVLRKDEVEDFQVTMKMRTPNPEFDESFEASKENPRFIRKDRKP